MPFVGEDCAASMIRRPPGAVGAVDSIDPTMAAATFATIDDLQHAHRRCHRCVDAGFIRQAHPVFSGHAGQRILLVGQAPGPVEIDVARPFAGRAGRQLMRWMLRAGFSDDEAVRRRVYMTAMTTCFPGKRLIGSGDRRPSVREVSLCAPWLESLLSLLQPRLILVVGSLALTRFLPGARLDGVVGDAFTSRGTRIDGMPGEAPVLLPLPHPSGQSRWLNEAPRAALLDAALRRLASLAVWADSGNN